VSKSLHNFNYHSSYLETSRATDQPGCS